MVPEHFQDVVVIEESSSWSNDEEDSNDGPVSSRQLAKIDKMNQTLANTLQNALERINYITEDIGSSSQRPIISNRVEANPSAFETQEVLYETTPRFKTQKTVGFAENSLRASNSSNNYQQFLNKLHST